MEAATTGHGTTPGAREEVHQYGTLTKATLTRPAALSIMDGIRNDLGWREVRMTAPLGDQYDENSAGWGVEAWRAAITRADLEKFIALAADFDCDYALFCGHALEVPVGGSEVMIRFT